MEEALSVDQLIDSLIDREGGYVNHPADKGGPTCFGVTEAVARAHGYAGPMRNLPRAEAAAIYRRIYWLRPRFDEVARRSATARGRAVRHRGQHGPGGRRDLRPARADRAQPQWRRLSRPGPRRPHRRTHAWRPSTPSSRCAAKPAARPSCCARSRRSRASATSAWPSGGQPTRRSFTAGSRTGLVINVTRSRHCEHPSGKFNNVLINPSNASPTPDLRRRPAAGLRPARGSRGHILRGLRGGDDRAPDVGRLVAGRGA